MPTSKQLPLVFISDAQLQRTAELLASFASKRAAEGVVYWFGIEASRTAVV